MRHFVLLCTLLIPCFGCVSETKAPEIRSDYNAIWACEVGYLSLVPPVALEAAEPVFEEPIEELETTEAFPSEDIGKCVSVDPDTESSVQLGMEQKQRKTYPVKRKLFRRPVRR